MAALGRDLHAVEDDARRIGAARALKMRHAGALGPRDHLLDPGGTIGVGGDDQRLATLRLQHVRQLAGGRRLARPIDAIEKDAGGRAVEIQLAALG